MGIGERAMDHTGAVRQNHARAEATSEPDNLVRWRVVWGVAGGGTTGGGSSDSIVVGM